MKLDVSKAYDRIERPFLRGIMVKLGLPKVWIDRVMKCVTTLTFSVCINGKAYGKISLRGESDKVTPYHPICFYCVEKVFHHY